MRAKDNPFRSDKIETIPYFLQDIQWEDLLSRLEMLKYKAAIVGEEGSGKTTLMTELREYYKKKGWKVCSLTLTEDSPSFSYKFLKKLRFNIDDQTLILLDGADRMSFLRWKMFERFTRNAKGTIVTVHALFILPELIYCRTNKEVLKKVLSHLLDGDIESVWTFSCNLLNKHDGNIRDVLRALYEQYALKNNRYQESF